MLAMHRLHFSVDGCFSIYSVPASYILPLSCERWGPDAIIDTDIVTILPREITREGFEKGNGIRTCSTDSMISAQTSCSSCKQQRDLWGIKAMGMRPRLADESQQQC